MWQLKHKEGWGLKNWCFQTVVLEKTFRIPWTARRSNQSIPKKINPDYLLEGLKLKIQYFGHLMQTKNHFIGKYSNAGKDWSQEEKGPTEDEMVGWHHWVNEHEFEQALGEVIQGSLARWSPWGCRVAHDWVTEQQQLMCPQNLVFYTISYDLVNYVPMFEVLLHDRWWHQTDPLAWLSCILDICFYFTFHWIGLAWGGIGSYLLK